jgi:hypothetical protein
LTLAQAQILRFDEHTVGAEITRLADATALPREGDVYGGFCAMPRVQSSLHAPSPSFLFSEVREDYAFPGYGITSAMSHARAALRYVEFGRMGI